MLNFINLARTVIKAVQSRNEENPNVKTADKSVFENMEKKVVEIEQVAQKDNTRSRADIYEEMRKRMQEVQLENEADPNIETADNSVFEDMQREIEELKKKVEAQQQASHTSDASHTNTAGSEMLAVINSMGGSLELRLEPNMGSAKSQVRVPDNATIQILGYSDNSIILDGRESKFVFVDYNGNRGWLLDSYLNRN